MPADLINTNKQETMKSTAEKLNKSIQNAFDAMTKATRADQNSNDALVRVKRAEATANSVRTEFNAVVGRATDSDAMSRQAAVNTKGEDKGTLKARIDDDVIRLHEKYDVNTEQIIEVDNKVIATVNQIEEMKAKTDTQGAIKIGYGAASNGPSGPVYEGENLYYKNIAIGGYALEKSVGSPNNIAIGWEALREAYSGEIYNIAIGHDALLNTKKTDQLNRFSATRNIGVGFNAMRFNVNGYQNVAFGRNTLQTSVNGNHNTAIGTNAMAGYSPIDLTGNIINTTKHDVNSSTAVGHSALQHNVSFNNTSVGANAAMNLKNANSVTAIGYNALGSLQSNMNTDGNKKVTTTISGPYVWEGDIITVTKNGHGLKKGYTISLSLRTGDVVSSETIPYIITSVDTNTFSVQAPINHSTSGSAVVEWYSDNTTVAELSHSTTAIGSNAMDFSKYGENNTALGSYSLRYINGDNNTSIGALSSINLQTGNNNTALGYAALRYAPDGSELTNVTNSTGIGYNSRVSGNDQVQLGGPGTSVYAYGALQNRSDIRDKADIRETKLGLDFIKKLRPVDFKWDMREDYTEIDETGSVIVHEKDGSKKRNRYHHGLIAQDVQKVIEETGVDFGGFQDHKIAGGHDVLTVGYTELIGPLIKAVQELTIEVEELKKLVNKND